MAKSHKMNRGVGGKEQKGGTEVKYPEGVHFIDSMGNIYASFEEIARCVPKYFTLDELKIAFDEGKLTVIDQAGLDQIQEIIRRK